jgi:hypothetical protein
MDDRIVTGTMSDVRFSVKYKDRTMKDVKMTNYVPGEFRIPDSDYVSLTGEHVYSVALKFTNTTYKMRQDRVKDYNISVGTSPFESQFYILHIYNMDNPRNKGEFVNRRGKPYLSEYQCSDGNTFILRTSKGAYW